VIRGLNNIYENFLEMENKFKSYESIKGNIKRPKIYFFIYFEVSYNISVKFKL